MMFFTFSMTALPILLTSGLHMRVWRTKWYTQFS